MASVSRGKPDKAINQIRKCLEDRHEAKHPHAKIELYRQNSVAVRIRIIDPDFADMTMAQRNDLVWSYIKKLPEAAQNDVSMLVLLAPDEVAKSLASLEFDDPVPSRL